MVDDKNNFDVNEDIGIDADMEPIDIGEAFVEIDRDECLIDTNEDSISYVEIKIRMYKDRMDSEKRLCDYARNEHNNNKNKAIGYFVVASILLLIAVKLYLYTGGEIAIGPLLIYPMVVVFIIGALFCSIKGIKLIGSSNIILDSYSLKYKNWLTVIGESNARKQVYVKEIKRLEKLLEEMQEEQMRLRENLKKVEEERENILK